MGHNLVHKSGVRDPQPAAKLAAQSGRDAHSIVAAGRFLDPARGDFRVSDDSPALSLGFVNFPMDQFGVRKPALKAIARTPSFAPPGTAEVTWEATIATAWLGAQVRTLATIEEASAVGVILAAGGILVVELPANSAAARAGLRQGDLIIGAAGQPVKSTADLLRLAPAGAGNAPSLRIVRDQAEQTMQRPNIP
jgi:membrane-associated protease RseP (regulator of RpoE activity)